VNALAKEEVGKFFKTQFIASYQKVGTFRVDGDQKQGGNVASYFCTADGEVIHIVAGPVSAEILLREARWAVETWKLAQLTTREMSPQLRAFMHNAHGARLLKEHGVDLRKPDQTWGNRGNVPPAQIYDQPRFRALNNAGRATCCSRQLRSFKSARFTGWFSSACSMSECRFFLWRWAKPTDHDTISQPGKTFSEEWR
jgi:hypothetical protein